MPKRAERALLAAVPLFAALADETRLRLVACLCDAEPMSISRLTAEAGVDVTRQAITKHLRLMEHAGLVVEARQGRESVWRLERRGLDDARRYLDRISTHWDEALGRLKSFVED